jgi:hypothetical protein
MLDKTSPANAARAELADAIAAHSEAARRLANATSALERADQALRAAEIDARRCASAQQDHIAAIESAVREGRRPPVGKSNHAARAEASEKIAAASIVQQKIAGELSAQRSKCAAAETLIADLCIPVAMSELDKVAAELEQANARVFDLAAQLRGYAAIWLPPAPNSTTLRPIPVSSRARAALDPKTPTFIPSAHPEVIAERKWRDFLNRLTTNANAQLEGE